MIVKWLNPLAAALILTVTGCSLLRFQPSSNVAGITDNSTRHTRKMETPAYRGDRGAIIFSLSQVTDSKLAAVIDRVVRVFAENGVPVDVAVQPGGEIKQQDLMNSLREYEDAGIADISIDGSELNWIDNDSPVDPNASAELKSQISGQIAGTSAYFGAPLAACMFPYEYLNENNYRVLQETGFKIISTQNPEGFVSSRQLVDWKGNPDTGGLCRLPVVGKINYRGVSNPKDVDTEIINGVTGSLDRLGIAVVEIEPVYFLGDNGKIDTARIQQLGSLIKAAKGIGEIITFDGWTRYAAGYFTATSSKRTMPAYNGGSAVIFRLDDVCAGWHEDADQEIIEIFKNNGVPLDCGVISNAGGSDSYQIPWLKKYVDAGNVGISVHGYDWTYYQLDTTKSGLTYDFIRYKLMKARDQYLQYFGLSPVALTVPTDYYDETGYRAIQQAGFKVFSTQILIEPHGSNQPVDYLGRRDMQGMYRIPNASDVSDWDAANETFTGVVDISKLAGMQDVCKNYKTFAQSASFSPFGYSLCSVLANIDVAAISLHPSAFVDKDGKPDHEKIRQLDPIIKWIKTFATITTFEQWYNYTSGAGSR